MNAVFEQLVQEALDADFAGWDFSAIKDRWVEAPVSWDYGAIVEKELPRSKSLLDMGTGGGEFFSSLRPLPRDVCATEGFEPNIPVARQALEPLGIQVIPCESDDDLPFDDDRFDLVISRHESFSPPELYRILRPGGVFVTQQVGGKDNAEVNVLLDAPVHTEFSDWDFNEAVRGLERSGFSVSEKQEEYPETKFFDIGAIVFFLKTIPWQIPGFRVEDYGERLFDLHERILSRGPLSVSSHRFFIVARKPDTETQRTVQGRR